MASGNLLFTMVIATFYCLFFIINVTVNPTVTKLNNNNPKQQTYGKFTVVNGKGQIHLYDEFTNNDCCGGNGGPGPANVDWVEVIVVKRGYFYPLPLTLIYRLLFNIYHDKTLKGKLLL